MNTEQSQDRELNLYPILFCLEKVLKAVAIADVVAVSKETRDSGFNIVLYSLE